LLFYVVHN